MKNKLVLKIAIIIIAFLLVFAIFLVIVVSNLSSSQLSYERADMVATQQNTNDENEVTTSTDETEEIEEEDVYTDSIVIRNLINNNWSRLSLNLSDDYEKDEDGNYVYDGYTLYTDDGVNVKSIIFNLDYEDEVISDLMVGAGYDEVVEAFGVAPTFENEQLNLYGYKTSTVYAFFYDDEICIYPNERFLNSDFEESLFEYLGGAFGEDQTRFVVHIRNNYSDFTAELEGEEVVLTSGNRQIQIRLNGNYAETEVIIYNGYTEGSLMEEYKENYNITEERTVDLVELIETERIMLK